MRYRQRHVSIDGVRYYIDQEEAARDGGSPPRWWYCVIFDLERGGWCIDERVPEEYFRTLREAKAALLRHVAERVKQ